MRKIIRPCGLHCIKVNHLGVTIGTQEILTDINLHIHCGTLNAVIGKNGAGKSTLVRAMLGEVPHTGSIEFKDRENGRMQKLKIGYVPQAVNIEKHTPVSVYDLIACYQSRFPVFLTKRKKLYGQIRESLRVFEAESLIDKQVCNLSGGELQRVSIARALITQPKLIIADEPVAAIDASMKMNIVNLFKELKEKYNVSFIYITHDLSTAYYVSDYIATLYRGCLIEYGPAKEIMDEPAHPYTELLMNAVPRVGDKWKEDLVMPDMEDKEFSIEYCKFAPRCPYATDECRKERPKETYLSDERKVLCYHPLNNGSK